MPLAASASLARHLACNGAPDTRCACSPATRQATSKAAWKAPADSCPQPCTCRHPQRLSHSPPHLRRPSHHGAASAGPHAGRRCPAARGRVAHVCGSPGSRLSGCPHGSGCHSRWQCRGGERCLYAHAGLQVCPASNPSDWPMLHQKLTRPRRWASSSRDHAPCALGYVQVGIFWAAHPVCEVNSHSLWLDAGRTSTSV